MHIARRLLLLAFLTSVAPTMGQARCEGAVMLMTFYNAYNVTLNGSAEAQRQAAKTTLVLSGGQTGDQIARQVAHSGVTVDVPRLSEVLEDARALASHVLAKTLVTDTDFRHGRNLDWLGELVLSTNCQGSAATASLTPDRSPNARATLKSVAHRSTGMDVVTNNSTVIALVLLFLIAIPASVVFLRSDFIRKRKVERLPRFPIAMGLDLTFTTPSGEMQEAQGEALDISQGGLKLRWDEPPPAGTLATMTLLGIQRLTRVIWANQHYAGLMFEETLTKAELKSLTETHAPV